MEDMKKKDIDTGMLRQERLKDAGDFPKVILIDTTNYCNLRCSMCGHRLMTRKKGTMDIKLFRKIIDEIAEKDKSVRVWMVFFGEALLLKDKLYPLISYAKDKGLKDVVLNSNGNLLDEKVCLGLIKSGLDAIYVGIDAFSSEVYQKLRVGGNYEKVVKNVNTLIQLEKRLRVNKPKVFVQFVEMEENEEETDAFTKYWSDQGAIVKIRPKVSWAGTVQSWKVKNLQRYPCYWLMRTLNICWDGRVALCSCDYDAKFVAGNVNKDPIQSIWSGKLKELRQAQTEGRWELLPKFCQECKDWQFARADYFQ